MTRKIIDPKAFYWHCPRFSRESYMTRKIIDPKPKSILLALSKVFEGVITDQFFRESIFAIFIGV